MPTYEFLTVWKLDASLEKVYSVIHNSDSYHLWWKGQSAVLRIKSGDPQGVGAVVKFRTRSWLPYYLSYTGTVKDVVPLKKISGTTVGELEGTGEWTFEGGDSMTIVTYHWVVKTNLTWMNILAPLLRPIFVWNHNIVMQWGGEGLAKFLNCRLIP